MIRKFPAAFIFVIVGALAQTTGAQSTDPSSSIPGLSVALWNVRGGLFARQQFSVEILWKGIFFQSGQIELLRDGQVVRQYPFGEPQAPGFATRGGRNWRTRVGLIVDADLPAGTYRVRARVKEHLSNVSEPFVVEPWGLAVDALQVGLSASPGGYAAGQPVIVTLTMRNAGAVPLCVPVPIDEQDPARVFAEFYQKDGAALFDLRPPLARGQVAGRSRSCGLVNRARCPSISITCRPGGATRRRSRIGRARMRSACRSTCSIARTTPVRIRGADGPRRTLSGSTSRLHEQASGRRVAAREV